MAAVANWHADSEHTLDPPSCGTLHVAPHVMLHLLLQPRSCRLEILQQWPIVCYDNVTQAGFGSQDKSWRVRYNVAQQLTALCEALGPELSRCALHAA